MKQIIIILMLITISFLSARELPPKPVLKGNPPEKPNLKALYTQKLTTPENYTKNWISPKIGTKTRFTSPSGWVYEGIIDEVADDYIKLAVKEKFGIVKIVYRKDKMHSKYKVKYLKSEYIKAQIMNELKQIQSKYKVDCVVYYKPLIDWEKRINQIKNAEEFAKRLENDKKEMEKLRAKQKAQKEAEIKAYGPQPSMTIIGWTQTVPLIVKLVLQRTMHDYKSFEKVSGTLFYTEYQGTKCWLYKLTYRGKNAFGGKVINTNHFYIRNNSLLGIK